VNVAVQHARSSHGKIETNIVEAGEVTLSPPGMSIVLDEIFAGI